MPNLKGAQVYYAYDDDDDDTTTNWNATAAKLPCILSAPLSNRVKHVRENGYKDTRNVKPKELGVGYCGDVHGTLSQKSDEKRRNRRSCEQRN